MVEGPSRIWVGLASYFCHFHVSRKGIHADATGCLGLPTGRSVCYSYGTGTNPDPSGQDGNTPGSDCDVAQSHLHANGDEQSKGSGSGDDEEYYAEPKGFVQDQDRDANWTDHHKVCYSTYSHSYLYRHTNKCSNGGQGTCDKLDEATGDRHKPRSSSGWSINSPTGVLYHVSTRIPESRRPKRRRLATTPR